MLLSGCGFRLQVPPRLLISFRMQGFRGGGGACSQGVDLVQACYGGTAAVQNAVNWVESRSWDGRYAVVVMSDISLYPKGPARPTSGERSPREGEVLGGWMYM